MDSFRRLIALAALAAALVGPAAAGVPAELRWTFAPAAGGQPVRLSDLKGKVLLLEFSATYCGPCHTWKPFFEEIQARYAERGLIVLEINNGEAAAVVRRYIGNHPSPIKTLLDPGRSAAHALLLKGEPAMALFDTNDSLVWSAVGFGPATKDELTWRIENILPGEPGSVPAGQLKQPDHL
jgi:thiol-disulfide isomerase/thioredoxin